jgi:hypothetical protein
MSKHNISHADIYTAGAGVSFNLPEGYDNALRGMPIFPVTIESFPGGTEDLDGIAESQQPALGGQQDLVLDGVFVDADGVAQLPYCTQVRIASIGNDSGRTFTVLGLDANGRPQAHEMPGANAGSSSTSKHFCSVDRIFVDDDTASTIVVGVTNVASRGLRMRSVTLPGEANPLRFGIEIGGGPLDAGYSFNGGNSDPQTATNSSPRASINPADENQTFSVLYMPDLTKEGVQPNYTDPSQTPSPF